jgi:hypothetical protein
MDDQTTNNGPIEIGSRVALLPGCEAVYEKAVAGSQGTIVAKKPDEDGFKMVYIEWDQDHWRFNGQDDQWTYEEHFKSIDGDGIFAALDDPEAFINRMLEKAKDRGGDEDEMEEYIERLDEVVNLLSDSEGFIVLTARRETHPQRPDKSFIVPYVYGAFLNKPIMALLESQMVQLAAVANQEMAMKLLERYQESDDDGDQEAV